MGIVELKSNIETNQLKGPQVWILDDENSLIICKQYIDKIAKNRNLNVKYIESVSSIVGDSFIEDDNLYIMITDKYTGAIDNENFITICKHSDIGVHIPKLEDWQVTDYVMSKLKGLDKQDIEWLITKYSGNYFRFLNDIDKLAIFDQGSQKIMFNFLLDDGHFDTLSNLTIWDLKDAVMKRDINKISNIIEVKDYIDIEPTGLYTTLYKAFKSLCMIQMNPRCTFEDAGLKSEKQLWFYRKNMCGYYSNKQLVDIMNLLTNTEYMFKYGGLSMDCLVDYLLVRILSFK